MKMIKKNEGKTKENKYLGQKRDYDDSKQIKIINFIIMKTSK